MVIGSAVLIDLTCSAHLLGSLLTLGFFISWVRAVDLRLLLDRSGREKSWVLQDWLHVDVVFNFYQVVVDFSVSALNAVHAITAVSCIILLLLHLEVHFVNTGLQLTLLSRLHCDVCTVHEVLPRTLAVPLGFLLGRLRNDLVQILSLHFQSKLDQQLLLLHLVALVDVQVEINFESVLQRLFLLFFKVLLVNGLLLLV